MSESYGGMTAVAGPQVSLYLDLSLAYMRQTQTDSSAIISAVKVAVADAINGTSTDATIEASTISDIASAVGGVLSVLSCAIDGSDIFTGDGGPSFTLVPNSVVINVRTLA